MARKKKSDVAVREDSPLDTIIGPGSFFEGTMKAEKSVRIDGIFKGELYCSGFLAINRSSEVHAQIEGMDVYINGSVRGTVRAERVQFDSEEISYTEILEVFFTIHDPKRRTICAASFRERVLHPAIMNICEPYFERYQIQLSY